MEAEQLFTGSKVDIWGQNFARKISKLVTDIDLGGQTEKEHGQK